METFLNTDTVDYLIFLSRDCNRSPKLAIVDLAIFSGSKNCTLAGLFMHSFHQVKIFTLT